MDECEPLAHGGGGGAVMGPMPQLEHRVGAAVFMVGQCRLTPA